MKTAAVGAQKKRVALVIDDNRLTRKLVREELEQRGFEVFEAEDTSDALRIYERQVPAVVTLDFDRVDGRAPEIAETLVDQVPGAKIVAITSEVLPAFRERLLTIGVKGIVVKPYDQPESVGAAIEGTLRAGRSTGRRKQADVGLRAGR